MSRSAYGALLFAVAGLGLAGPAGALTNGSYAGYSVRLWQSEDGLPQNTVTAITQTRDGYLWIGTLAGLARFDGERFETFDSDSEEGLVDRRIAALCVDRDNTLWIAHYSGLITRYRDGSFQTLPGTRGSHARVAAMFTDENDTVWVLRAGGALERPEQPGAPAAAEEAGRVRQVRWAGNAAGHTWFSVDGDANELRGGRVRPVDLGAARHTGYVRGLAAAHDGSWWVVHDGSIRKRRDGQWTESRGPWGASEINSMLELRDGSLAIATMDDGFHLVGPDGAALVFNHRTASIQNWARVLFEDREGTLWIGAGSGGLAAVRRTAFTVLNPPDNWQGRTVLAVVASGDGALWVGTEGAGVYRHFQNAWQHYGMAEGFENLFIWSVAADARGQIWAGTWGGGLYRLEGPRFVPAPDLQIGSAPVLALFFGQPGSPAWIGTGDGLLIREEGAPPRRLLHGEEPETVGVLGLVRDADPAVTWLALGDAGLGRLAGRDLRRFTARDGLVGNGVQSLLADGDTLWIGTQDGGLNRFRAGRFATIGPKQGLPSKTVCHIADDGLGYLWLSTHHGIFRVAKTELNRCADGLSPSVAGQIYDKNDGLPTIEYSGGLQAAGCRTRDGRLWFTSSKGLVGVDPAAIRLNPLPPPVVIQALHVDGQRLPARPGARDPLRLRPEHQRLEFQYAALSFAATGKTLFKYRLTGLDQGWIDAGPKRTASYSHLPPGDYRFQVIACNNDGVWNPAGASLAFTVPPFYWQTWWFRTAGALALLFAVGWAVRHETRRRMQRRVEELEHERGIERERARIAQDIHDDIGSSLTRITMLSQSAQPGADPHATRQLGRIHDTALEVTHALDEIVWAVNPQHDSLDSLVGYLARFAQDRLGEAGVRCRLDLPVKLPAWPLTTQMRHDLLLAFKEAVNNALKHAQATEVRVALEVGRDHFVILVQDNGRGFDPAGLSGAPADRTGGNGLGHLRGRLERNGGACSITSAPGRGARIAFTVRLPRLSVQPVRP